MPTSFRVERRDHSGTDYTVIANGVANSSSHAAGKIKVRDKSALPGRDYRYRLVVIYEGGENSGEFTLRDGKVKTIPFLRYDFKLEGTATAEGNTISWRPAVWDALEYTVTRANPAGSPIPIGTVAHDASTRRLSITDTTATSLGTHRYFFFSWVSEGNAGDLSQGVDATRP